MQLRGPHSPGVVRLPVQTNVEGTEMIYASPIRVPRWLASLVAFAALTMPCFSAPSATARVKTGAFACHVVTFPKWTGPPGNGRWEFDFYDGEGELVFRERSDGEVLVSGRVKDVRGLRESGTTCLLNLEAGVCRPVLREEWDRAVPFTRKRTWAEPELVKSSDALTFGGKRYPKSGPKWMSPSDGTQRSPASSDGRYFAVYSYSGNYRSYHPLEDPKIFRFRDPVRGKFFIDIYEREGARLAVSVEGSFRGLGVNEILQDSFWLKRYYYVVPLSVDGKKKILVCNVAAADPANRPPAANKPGRK